MNVQFAVKDGVVYLIEVNPRASRTVPFVAKAIGSPIAKIAARVMAGEKLADFPPIDRDIRHIAVKEAVFPFARFPGIDPVLSPEMKSTGEVMGIDWRFRRRPSSSRSSAAGLDPADRGQPCSSRSRTATSRLIVPAVRALIELGFEVDRDRRHRRLSARGRGSPSRRVNKVAQGRPHIVDRIKDGERRHHLQHHRRLAEPQGFRLDPRLGGDRQKMPYFTTAASASRWPGRSRRCRDHGLEVRSLQDYYSASRA